MMARDEDNLLGSEGILEDGMLRMWTICFWGHISTSKCTNNLRYHAQWNQGTS